MCQVHRLHRWTWTCSSLKLPSFAFHSREMISGYARAFKLEISSNDTLEEITKKYRLNGKWKLNNGWSELELISSSVQFNSVRFIKKKSSSTSNYLEKDRSSVQSISFHLEKFLSITLNQLKFHQRTWTELIVHLKSSLVPLIQSDEIWTNEHVSAFKLQRSSNVTAYKIIENSWKDSLKKRWKWNLKRNELELISNSVKFSLFEKKKEVKF